MTQKTQKTPFPEGTKCPTCKKDLNDVVAMRTPCEPCMNYAEKIVANYSILRHLWEAFVGLFNFDLVTLISELKWAQERICKTGDYHPKTGKFYRKGYLK